MAGGEGPFPAPAAASYGDEIKRLQDENEELRSEMYELKRKHAVERERAVTLEEDYKDLERELGRVRQQKEAALHKYDQDLDAARVREGSLQGEVKSIAQDLEKERAANQELEQRLKESAEQVEILAAVLEDKNVRMEQLYKTVR